MRDNDIAFMAELLRKGTLGEAVTQEEKDYITALAANFKQPGDRVESVGEPGVVPAFTGAIASIDKDKVTVTLDADTVVGGYTVPAGSDLEVPLTNVKKSLAP